MDEMTTITLQGERRDLCRAVDHDENVIDIFTVLARALLIERIKYHLLRAQSFSFRREVTSTC